MKILIASFRLMAAVLFVISCLPEAPEVSMAAEPSTYSLHLEQIGPSAGI